MIPSPPSSGPPVQDPTEPTIPGRPIPSKANKKWDHLAKDPTGTWRSLQKKQAFESVQITSSAAPASPTRLRVVCVSDTHGKHRQVVLPAGDVLIHAGDFSNTGEIKQVRDLHEWMSEAPFKQKIVIAGNHDITFEEGYYEASGRKRFHYGKGWDPKEVRAILTESKTVTYLEDAGCKIAIGEGGAELSVWGSPWQPEFCDWAFNLDRGAQSRTVWDKIPDDTDILITHGPPLGRGDLCTSGDRAGCLDLLETIQKRVKPALHIFGHVHEAYGLTSDGSTVFVNASTCTFRYLPINPPVVLDVEVESGQIASVTQVHSRVYDWTEEQVAEYLQKILKPDVVAALQGLDGKQLLELDFNALSMRLRDLSAYSMINARSSVLKQIAQLATENF